MAPGLVNCKMKIRIKNWKAVAYWRWDVNDDCCGICRTEFESCCPSCRIPGEDCPPIIGRCNHTFHLHCIMKWIDARQTETPQCPLCRGDWHFKGQEDSSNITEENAATDIPSGMDITLGVDEDVSNDSADLNIANNFDVNETPVRFDSS